MHIKYINMPICKTINACHSVIWDHKTGGRSVDILHIYVHYTYILPCILDMFNSTVPFLIFYTILFSIYICIVPGPQGIYHAVHALYLFPIVHVARSKSWSTYKKDKYSHPGFWIVVFLFSLFYDDYSVTFPTKILLSALFCHVGLQCTRSQSIWYTFTSKINNHVVTSWHLLCLFYFLC